MTSNNFCAIDIEGIQLQILEDLNDNDEDVEENVGRFIWPTALPMMKHILKMILPSDECYNDTIIIELGAGCGLLGMGLAASCVFSKVIITDHDDVWLCRNLDLNSDVLGDKVMAMRLDWGNTSEIDSVLNLVLQPSSSARNILIVASDVLYNHSSHENLVRTLHKLSYHNLPTRILIGFLNDRDNDEASFLSVARRVFGSTFPTTTSIMVERKSGDRTKRIELHLIEFIVK